MPMTRHLLFACAALSILLAGCGDPAAPAAVPPGPSEARDGAKSHTFSLVPLAELAIYPERSAPAAVIGRDEARISAEVAATILALPVEVGQRVRKGAMIARLDPRDAELALERAAAALAQAEAHHAQAQAQLERARTLREKNFYSAEALTLRETGLAVAAADLRAARAQRDTARRHLDKHTLAAPFDAIVRARPGQTGELATPGMPLLTLVSADALELSARLQPRDADSLAVAPAPTNVPPHARNTRSLPPTGGASAWGGPAPTNVPPHARNTRSLPPTGGASAWGGPAPTFVTSDASYEMKLLRISPALDRDTRSREARLAFVDAPPPVGSEGRLRWRETQAHVPAELLVRRDERLGVFVAPAGIARFHVLEHAQEGRPAAIDLPGDTPVVVQGRHALRDGMRLQ